MPMRDAAAVAAKWQQNTGAASQAYADGVDAVTVAPGQAAARQAEVWAANTAAAKGKFQRKVSQVSLTDWQTAAKTKGAQRLASGVQAAAPKFEQQIGKVLAHIEAGRRNLPPRGNLEQNLNRMTQFARHMAGYQG